jgi:hypothetical protein
MQIQAAEFVKYEKLQGKDCFVNGGRVAACGGRTNAFALRWFRFVLAY